jgi:hypothetical protein
MESFLKLLGLLRHALAIPFMFLFGFKIPVHLGHFTLVLGDFFMATQPWLFTWLIVLNTVAIVLDLKDLYDQFKAHQADNGSGISFFNALTHGDLPHAFYQKLFWFATFTLGLAIGSAFFIAFLVTGIPPLVVVAKTLLTVAFGSMLLQTVYEAGIGEKAAWTKAPATHAVNFLNASFSVATLVILLFFPGVNAITVSLLAITCTALTIILTYQGHQAQAKEKAPPKERIGLTTTLAQKQTSRDAKGINDKLQAAQPARDHSSTPTGDAGHTDREGNFLTSAHRNNPLSSSNGSLVSYETANEDSDSDYDPKSATPC